MKSLALLLGLVLCFFSVVAQKISNVDFDLIKEATTDSSSAYYYPKLIDRMEAGDSTLAIDDYAFIYYGHVFTDSYNPYGDAEEKDSFIEKYKAGEYKQAIEYGKKVLDENPANLAITFKMLVCVHQLADTALIEHYRIRYFSLLEAVYKSGNGGSKETAIVVNRVDDEYEIMNDLQIRGSFVSQTLSGNTDIIDFDTAKQERENKIEKLYFNVSMPLQHMMKMFKGIEEKEDNANQKKKSKKKKRIKD